MLWATAGFACWASATALQLQRASILHNVPSTCVDGGHGMRLVAGRTFASPCFWLGEVRWYGLEVEESGERVDRRNGLSRRSKAATAWSATVLAWVRRIYKLLYFSESTIKIHADYLLTEFSCGALIGTSHRRRIAFTSMTADTLRLCL